MNLLENFEKILKIEYDEKTGLDGFKRTYNEHMLVFDTYKQNIIKMANEYDNAKLVTPKGAAAQLKKEETERNTNEFHKKMAKYKKFAEETLKGKQFFNFINEDRYDKKRFVDETKNDFIYLWSLAYAVKRYDSPKDDLKGAIDPQSVDVANKVLSDILEETNGVIDGFRKNKGTDADVLKVVKAKINMKIDELNTEIMIYVQKYDVNKINDVIMAIS